MTRATNKKIINSLATLGKIFALQAKERNLACTFQKNPRSSFHVSKVSIPSVKREYKKKGSPKIDFCHYNDDAKYESGEDDTEILGVNQLNISESGDDKISNLDI